eukprot:TRINITY_DN2552_c0_g4_i1.p2 TRINITY_DN2552_c0_g4~~TRINITY_DN2552_c0_g4_i1.p2  ORF type:complete len:135 (+),score=18.06 TRINITY_DN2552_c0_g4_i1:70-474(+)
MAGPQPEADRNPSQSPPCGHKHFTRIEKMNGDVTVLRCRVHGCRQLWCTNVKELEKCQAHFSGGCTNPKCTNTHVFKRKGRRKGKKGLKRGINRQDSFQLSSEEEGTRIVCHLMEDEDEIPPLCDVPEHELIYQ